MTPHQTAGDDLTVSRNAANETFRDALRLYVGRGRRYQFKQVAKGTGIAARKLEALTTLDPAESRGPTFAEALTLAKFLGAEFTAEWLEMIGQGAFELPDDDGTPPGALAADMSEDAARVTRLAVEGATADHPTLREVGRREMVRGATLFRRAA
jgi:hypothetical protein